MNEKDLHANQEALFQRAPNSLTSATLDTHPENRYRPILYNQAAQYPYAPLHPSNSTRRSFESTSGQLDYAAYSQQNSSSVSSSGQYSFPDPIGGIGHSRSRTRYSLRLGNNSVLNYHAEDRTYLHSCKVLKIPTREYLRKLQAVWDDADEHWDESQCTYKIRGVPIAMKFWGADTINPWDGALRTKHSRCEPIMEELKKYTSINEFLLVYSDSNGRAPTIADLCKKVRDAQGRKGNRCEKNEEQNLDYINIHQHLAYRR
ncbi:hypothetical protein FB446DRAFT_795766 [Lentinula raphanica]|nr:hypothetical protein FB446DRAFT_795766 [Lentinula raphanica]